MTEEVQIGTASELNNLHRDPLFRLSLYLLQFHFENQSKSPGGGKSFPAFCTFYKLEPTVGGLVRGYPEGFCRLGAYAAKLPEGARPGARAGHPAGGGGTGGPGAGVGLPYP